MRARVGGEGPARASRGRGEETDLGEGGRVANRVPEAVVPDDRGAAEGESMVSGRQGRQRQLREAVAVELTFPGP